MAVEGVSLVLGSCSTLGLVGESGSGKSTLARLVARLLNPSSGNVFLHGRPLFPEKGNPASSGHKARAFRRSLPARLQMIFQDPYSSLNPRLRVGSSIAEPLLGLGLSRRARQERVEALLAEVGLDQSDAGRYPHEFSGGQRQRVALARALAPGPELLICDEPVSSLDASVQAQVLNLLKDRQEALGLSYLFISHDLAVVSHMSDQIAVMYLGRIVEQGEAESLFHQPKHPYTRVLLDASGQKRLSPSEGLSDRAGANSSAEGNPGWEEGCAFAPRCPEAAASCFRRIPELRPAGAGQVRCWA